MRRGSKGFAGCLAEATLFNRWGSSWTMADSPELNIDRVAELARIALTPAEKAEFSAQLGEVLKHVDQLKQLDVTNVEPSAHAFAVENVWADDVAQAGLPVTEALRNAPAQRDHMVAVPKVVE